MLTDAQFYVRCLELLLRDSMPDYDELAEEADLREYMESTFQVKPEEEDEGMSMSVAETQVRLTLNGLIAALGRRVGIDIKNI